MTKDGACPGYNKGDAPTVCVEGRGHDHGSHKRVHRAMNAALRVGATGGTISMDGAINAAVASHAAAFPLSKCSPGCIRAQLEAYYKEKCPNATLPALDQDGKIIEGDATSGADD
jgi:hypothetical protein